jgi:hypothetical protein
VTPQEIVNKVGPAAILEELKLFAETHAAELLRATLQHRSLDVLREITRLRHGADVSSVWQLVGEARAFENAASELENLIATMRGRVEELRKRREAQGAPF